VPESRLRLLVACGAAGGISATFNAPIAGVVFALELILRDFEAESFGVVVPASVVANVIGRAAFGSRPFLELPPFQLTSLGEYGLYAGLGIAAAFAGVGFIRALYGLEDVADRVWRGPEWLRPAAGGLVLGLLLLVLPEMYGVGYPVLEHAIRGDYALGFLLLFFAGKIVATSLTIAIGGSGGVFAPSLFIGAMLGTAYGDVVHRLVPSLQGAAGAYGLVGMGAVFAGASRAPMTAVIIIFELTGDYQIILPLMFAIAVATGGSSLLSADTIYTLKLRRRGINIRRGQPVDPMEALRVRDAMGPVPAAIPSEMPLSEIVGKLAGTDLDGLPVVEADGRYRGVITTRQLERALGSTSDAVASTLAEQPPTLTAGQSLTQALPLLLHGETSGLPVLSDDETIVIGWLIHRNVLQAYQARMRGLAMHPTRATSSESPSAAGENPERLSP
jgi:CIC family chloride channel protein